MKASVQIVNTTSTVYTVPTNMTAYIYVDIFPVSSSPSVTVYVNSLIYFTGSIRQQFSAKLILNSGDTVSVQTNGTVNVFVHGREE